MKKIKLSLLLAGLILSMLGFAGCGEKEEEQEEVVAVELNISAASSLREALPEIISEYQKTHSEVTFVDTYDSSGTLQTQIEAGAPCDIFISAATKQMDALNENGYIEEESITKLLKGKLVLVVPSNSTLDITSFEDITDSSVEVIAVGDVASVPVGQYTQIVLENLNIWESVSGKINYGTNVAGVLAWVESGDVDCGFVYATDAATTDKVKVVWRSAGRYGRRNYIYPAGILKNSENMEAAEEFMDFLKGEEATEIFIKYGFDIYTQ
jgi:molybdate transport system substrate-binding protein